MVDLESGATNSDQDVEGGSKMDKKRLGRLRSGSLSFKGPAVTNDDGLYSSDDEEKPMVLGSEEASTSGRVVKEINGRLRSYGGNSKKHPKPPRHPMSSNSLDADSMRLVREITQVTQQKRARIERMRALKSKKADSKASSSSTSNILAMIVTVIFVCIIIFQGILGARV